MEITNEQRRFHFGLWMKANNLRGSMSSSLFKSYFLGFLFYRYLSEKVALCANRMMADVGYDDYDYVATDDKEAMDAREYLVEHLGFFLPPSHLFCNVCRVCCEDETLNSRLSFIFRSIEASAHDTSAEQSLYGIFGNFLVDNSILGADSKSRSSFLSMIMKTVQQVDFDYVIERCPDEDVWGDAFEHLISRYASVSTMPGGDSYTPSEVSELLVRLACHGNPDPLRIYDPACGTGSMLLKLRKVIPPGLCDNLQFYGQEIEPSIFNLCRANMLIHGVRFTNFDIQLGDTLMFPRHVDQKPFGVIVCNPPFSLRWDGYYNSSLFNDVRFSPSRWIAPPQAADLAFVMHVLYHLSDTGTAVMLESQGVMLRGGDEEEIRNYLVGNNYVDTVIQLPASLLYGSDIAPCVLVLRKAQRPDNNVLFIDASKLYVKGWKKNILSREDIDKIEGLYKERKTIKNLCRLVPQSEVQDNNCALNVARYVEYDTHSISIDIEALNGELDEVMARTNALRADVECYSNISLHDLLTRDDVVYYPLGNLYSIKGRIGFRGYASCDYVEPGEGAIVLGPGNIVDGALNYDKCKYINWDRYEGSPEIMLFEDDILFCKTGSTLGKMAMVRDLPERATINPQLVVLKRIYQDINPKYLYYVMQSNEFQNKVRTLSGGVTIPTISQSRLATIPVPIVSLERQCEIVEILDKFEEIIANIKREQELKAKQYEYYRGQMRTL